MRALGQRQELQRGLLGVHQTNAANTAENNLLQRGLQGLQLEEQIAQNKATNENARAAQTDAAERRALEERRVRVAEAAEARAAAPKVSAGTAPDIPRILDANAIDSTGKIDPVRRARLEQQFAVSAVQLGKSSAADLSTDQVNQLTALSKLDSRLREGDGRLKRFFSPRATSSDLTGYLPDTSAGIEGAFETSRFFGGDSIKLRNGEVISVNELRKGGKDGGADDQDVMRVYGPYIKAYDEFKKQQKK